MKPHLPIVEATPSRPAITSVTPRLLYRSLAVAEAATWAMLITGMVLKYILKVTDIGVAIGGGLHGLVFVAYCMTVILVGVNQRWRARTIAVAMVAAVIPFATIPFERRVERKGLLEGAWRRITTDDPRDSRPLNRLLRWYLNHPAVLAMVSVALLVAVVTALLILGPPGGR